MFRATTIAAALAGLVISAAGFAQQEAVTPKEQLQFSDAKTMGWTKSANLGVNLSFSSSQDVVGQTDGNSETYGANLKSGFNHRSEAAEWRNTLSLTETTTKTPSIPRYVKSSDELKLETLYLYSLPNYPKIGPYARAQASTALFKGEDIPAADRSYVFQDQDGATVAGPLTTGTVRLTDGFKPLNTKESVGFFWKAKEDPNLNVLVRLGFGAVQIQADGQYALAGTDAAGNIIVKELSDVSQAGLEAGLGVKGRVDEKTGYELGIETLTPFINNKRSGDNRNAVELTNVDAFAKLTSNITSWASFGYDYKMKLEPQLVNRVQNIHMIVLNVNYNLF